MQSSAREILRGTGVEIHPDEFTVLSLNPAQWSKLLEDETLSPSGRFPFVIFFEPNGITLVLGRDDFGKVRGALSDFPAESGFRLMTFTSAMDFGIVGFLAEVSRILADAGVPILALSSFSRDHLLIKQSDLSTAMTALGPHVDGLC